MSFDTLLANSVWAVQLVQTPYRRSARPILTFSHIKTRLWCLVDPSLHPTYRVSFPSHFILAYRLIPRVSESGTLNVLIFQVSLAHRRCAVRSRLCAVDHFRDCLCRDIARRVLSTHQECVSHHSRARYNSTHGRTVSPNIESSSYPPLSQFTITEWSFSRCAPSKPTRHQRISPRASPSTGK